MNLHSKEDYQNVLLDLLTPLKPWFSDGGARIKLPGAGACYGQDAIEMEAFARPLWGLVPYWAGGGRADDFQEIYQKGIVAGTTPEHPEYWGTCQDCDQKFVEMAPIALGMLMVPQILWEPLTDTEKQNLASWLHQINDYELPRCNWYFFRILVNLALKTRGCSYDSERLVTDMAYMEACYLGNGWYVDGQSTQKDYYSAFAMQFYSLLYSMYTKEECPERIEEFRERGRLFSKDFIYWFDGFGAALPFGRSLTYRFAQAAFWSASLVSGAVSADLGVIKGIISRNLEYWLSKPIFQGDGTLSIGYAYPNLSMAERYNAPGSPYWCTKMFLLLSLPDDHPFWAAEALPLPALEPVYRIGEAEMLIQHRGSDLTAYVPAKYSQNMLGHHSEKYGKFAYSTAFGFSVSHSCELLTEAAPDSTLAFVTEEDGLVYVRRRSQDFEIGIDSIRSRWSPLAGITVETEIKLIDGGHTRRHKITSNRRCRAYDCGFAVPCFEDGYKEKADSAFVEIGNELHSCRMEALSEGLNPHVIAAVANTNVLYKNTAIPALWCQIEPGETVMETKITTQVTVPAGGNDETTL